MVSGSPALQQAGLQGMQYRTDATLREACVPHGAPCVKGYRLPWLQVLHQRLSGKLGSFPWPGQEVAKSTQRTQFSSAAALGGSLCLVQTLDKVPWPGFRLPVPEQSCRGQPTHSEREAALRVAATSGIH